MADALDSGSSGATRWGFDSPLPHHTLSEYLNRPLIRILEFSASHRAQVFLEFAISIYFVKKYNILYSEFV